MITHSQRVRVQDFHQSWFNERVSELGERWTLHRKVWEFAFIAQVFHESVLFRPCRALGFGVGREPLPAWLASEGCDVIATDQALSSAGAWAQTQQHASTMTWPDGVTFQTCDMNASLAHFRDFDFVWSAGSFEHLGSFEHSYRFLLESSLCLRHGGLAVHTTEFNPDPDHDTLSQGGVVLFREQELREAERRLTRAGFRLWPLDLQPGDTDVDLHIDREPYGIPHLSLRVGSCVTTSLALVIERGPDATDTMDR